MGEFVSYPKFVSPATKTLHPDSIGAILKLLGGVSIGNSDTPLTGQLKVGVAAGSGYITFYPGSYVPGHLDGSELLFDISGAEALKLLADGTLRIRNNKMFTARNAADNADLALVGRNASNDLVLGSGLTGVLKASSSVVSASGIVNADVDAAAAIAKSKLNLTGAILTADLNSTLYNTGTYSPTLAGSTTPGTNTYTAATVGKYWQFASMMVVIFHLQMASKDAGMAGNLYVTMPATMASSLPVSGAFPTLFDNVDFAPGYTQFSYYMSAGTNWLMLAQQGDNVAASNVDVAAVTTSSVLRGVAIFPV